MRNFLNMCLLIAFTLLLVACGSNPAATPTQPRRGASPTGTPNATTRPATKVTLALDWTPNTNHTGIYVAQAKGWYREQGIDLQILPFAEGTTTETLVSNGKADFGISFEESVVTSRAAGQDVISIAAVIGTNTSALVTLKNSGLDRPRELDGKRYAGYGAPFEAPVISSVIKADGGKGEFKSVTANLYAYDAVKAGQADFVWIFMGWDGIAAKRAGVPLNSFYIKDYGVPDYYTPVIITSNKRIQSDPDTVRRFMAATARGYEWAIEHPSEAADLLIGAAPKGTFSDPGLVKESQAWLSPKYKGATANARWGVQDPKVWTDYPRFMYGTGKVTDAAGKPLSEAPEPDTYFTNEFLP